MSDYAAECRRHGDRRHRQASRHRPAQPRLLLVSCGDASELARERENWCKKKLVLSGDAAIDAAIRKVCETMKGGHNKSRVTFYYLVADRYGKLGAVA